MDQDKDITTRAEQLKTAEVFDAYQTSYTEAVGKAVAFSGMSPDLFTRIKAGYILDLVSEHFDAPETITALDVGCGIGNFHPLLAPHFGQIHGIDVSAASISQAQQSNPGVLYDVYDGQTLPYEDDSFDLAFTICVMHHVPPAHWDQFVSEMHRVLRPDGLALVFEHNPRNPLTMRAVNNCPFDADAVLLPSRKTVDLFTLAGFKSVQSNFILSIPAATKGLRKADRLFQKIPFGAQYYVSATDRVS